MKIRKRLHLPWIAALTISAVSLAGAFALANTAKAVNQTPPLPTAAPGGRAADAARGRSLFVRSCAHCHGEDAGGSGEDADGPDLHGLRISDARIRTVIRAGISGEMPSFAKKHSPADAADIIAYLRSL